MKSKHHLKVFEVASPVNNPDAGRQARIAELKARQRELHRELAEVTLLLTEAQLDTSLPDDEIQKAIYLALAARPHGVWGYMRLTAAAGLQEIKEVKKWIKRNPTLIRKVGAKFYLPE